MKKIMTLALGMAVAVTASAQDWQDARFFTENNYLGTARTLGMGNAVTAIGGDPGSLVLNPAGSAVAGYSQFVISPGFTFSLAGSTGVVAPGSSVPVGLGDAVTTPYGRFGLPNLGMIFSFDTGRRTGWKRTVFGLMMSGTNNYTGRIKASGINEDTSYAAALASSAEGYTETVLGTEDWWYSGSDLSRMPKWVDMVAYRSGMFNGVPGMNNIYQAVTELRDASGDFWLAAPVVQRYGQQTSGSKNDIVFNFAANYEDRFYIGANLGFVNLNYAMAEYFQELPENEGDFPEIVYTDGSRGRFSSLQMKHNYSLRGTGVYAKLGVLWRPAGGLRLAAAVQSPTLTRFVARQAYSGEVILTGKSLVPSTSPEDSWGYSMLQPMRVNAGLAYSFGSLAVLSADYELVNYGSIRYSGEDGSTPTYLTYANQDIEDALGFAHQIRVGGEIKPTPELSLRVGYNWITYGQKNWLEDDWSLTPLTLKEKFSLAKTNVSFGAGYSFGSFYLDAAVRLRFMPKEYIVPYYYYDYSDFTDKYIDPDILTPEIEVKSTLTDVVLTAGWRF